MENSTTLGIDNNKDRPTQFSPKQSKSSRSKYCAVCGKSSMNYPKLMFHAFPKQKLMIRTQDADGTIVMKDRRQVWYDKTLIRKNLKSPLVCSLHFRDSDYFAPDVHGKTHRYLKRIAVPTLDLPSPGSSLCQHRNQKRIEDYIARMKKKYAPSHVQETKSVTEEKKSSVVIIQKQIILQPLICNPKLFAPIFNEFWCNADNIILPNERWSFCKLETTECGKELVFSEMMYDGKSKMRSTKKQVVLSCQNGFQYFIHSKQLTSKQISTRINENVSTIELLQSLLCAVDIAEVSNGVWHSTSCNPHSSSYQELDHNTMDPFADNNQEQCKTPIVSGNKVSLNSKIDNHLMSLKSNEIQDSRNDHSRVLPIESVFIKEERIDDCQNGTIDSEQLMFIKEERIDCQNDTIDSEQLMFIKEERIDCQNETIDSEQLMFIKEESSEIHENDDLTLHN